MNAGLNISLNDTSEVVCENCGHKYFEQAVYIRMASGLLTGTGMPSYIPIPVFKCSACGHVNKEFLPKEIRSIEELN